MDDAAKAQLGAVAEDPVLAIARESALRAKQHRVARVTASREQALRLGPVELDEALVGIDIQYPFPERSIDRGVPGGRKIIGPSELKQPGAEVAGNFARTVGRSGIDHDDFVDAADERAQAGFEKALL